MKHTNTDDTVHACDKQIHQSLSVHIICFNICQYKNTTGSVCWCCTGLTSNRVLMTDGGMNIRPVTSLEEDPHINLFNGVGDELFLSKKSDLCQSLRSQNLDMAY